MTTTKRIGASTRADRPNTGRQIRVMLRPGPADRVVRWIGAGKRRTSVPVEPTGHEGPCAEIIPLSWVDTFGRPARLGVIGFGQAAATVARVLPFAGKSPSQNTRSPDDFLPHATVQREFCERL